MQHWQRVWRRGLAAEMPTAGLEHLRLALIRNDSCLIQQTTIFPLPSELTAGDQVECACAVGYCLWKGLGMRTVGALNDAFGKICTQADERLGEIAGCRLFFDWYDSVPRQQMRFELLHEVNRVLNERHESAA